MKQIVCLSYTPWSSTPNRTQQLMSHLSGFDILFFEPAGPKASERGRKVRPNVVVYQLPRMIPVASRSAPVARLNRRRIASCIERAMTRHRFREPLLWCTTPENIHQVDYLAYHGLVYDCHRYWSDLPVEWEGDLAAAAEVCFVASEGLSDRLSPCNDNLALLPNGNTYPLFSRELVETPPELSDLEGQPVLGYVGALTADLDVAPLVMAADAHPEWTFLLIGPVEKSGYLPYLEQRKNIRILGKRPPVELPDYLSCCTACFDLLRDFDEDSDVVPARIYEYLAAGKPVISMLWKHQRSDFPDLVRPARTPEIFVEQCAAALQEDPSALLQRRRETAAAAAWDLRAGSVADILQANGLDH